MIMNDELVNEALNHKRQVVSWARKSSRGALLVSIRHLYDEIHDLKVLDLTNEKRKDMELTGEHQPLSTYQYELLSKAHKYTLERMKLAFQDYCKQCDSVYQISEGHECEGCT